MADPFIAEINMVGFNFPPRGWAECNGQLLPISSNSALFSLLGTIYGGDGRTSFALPELRSRAPVHAGQGPGLSDYRLGERTGTENNTLATANLPAHSHSAAQPISTADGDQTSPSGNYPAVVKVRANTATAYNATATSGRFLEATDSASTGGSTPVNNMQPYLTVNFVIALIGVFPSRS